MSETQEEKLPWSEQRTSLTNVLLSLIPLLPCVYFILPYISGKSQLQFDILITIVISIGAFFLTISILPNTAKATRKAGLWGKDLNKGEKGLKLRVPESGGIVPGTIYVIAVCLLQVLVFKDNHKAVDYNAGLFSICFMLFLGFADDVLDLRWRYKLVLPTIASIPLILSYTGLTCVVVPVPLRSFFGTKLLELGIIYHLYMMNVAVFCTNSINIYAGINGLEAGQSLIIACAVLLHNLLELNGPGQEQHLFSLVFIIPFIAVTLGLLKYNWYPSSVFVGDTFTYYAGMTLAVVGILGHFSKTLMLFFIPQWINFILSLPQLLKIIPIPRHRIPRFDEKTGKLKSSGNYTLLNAALYFLGPTSERTLCIIMLGFQIFCCGLGFFIRYYLSTLFFD